VRDFMVEAEASREPHPRLESVSRFEPRIAEECSHAILNSRRYVEEGVAGLDRVLNPVPDLTMHFCSFPVVIQECRVLEVLAATVTPFGSCRASSVCILGIAEVLAGGILSGGKELGQGHSRRR
jgi:hypothetical protein